VSGPRRLLALSVVLLAVGCGGSEQQEPTAPSAQAARATVEQYLAALARADGAAMCRVLTPALQERLTARVRAGSCPEAAATVARSVPPELRDRSSLAVVGRPRVAGRGARVPTRAGTRYASRARTSSIALEARDGRWLISELPRDERPDPVTTCIVTGIQTFERGEADPFWQREGRADFVEFIRRACKDLSRAGVPQSADAAEDPRARRIFAAVLRDLVREGRIERP
jgi:hypothetical protein